MPVNIEQWCAEIESFNGCSLYSIVKLHLNLFNLLFHVFLVFICIIELTVCYITKFPSLFVSSYTFYICLSIFSFIVYLLEQFSQFLWAHFPRKAVYYLLVLNYICWCCMLYIFLTYNFAPILDLQMIKIEISLIVTGMLITYEHITFLDSSARSI